MQLGSAQLTLEECQRRQQEGRCFYCGSVGHLVSSCLTKKLQSVSSNQVSKTLYCALTKINFNSIHDLELLIDSESYGLGIGKKLGIESKPLPRPIRAQSLNGKELFAITHISKLVKMTIGHHHHLHFTLSDSGTTMAFSA